MVAVAGIGGVVAAFALGEQGSQARDDRAASPPVGDEPSGVPDEPVDGIEPTPVAMEPPVAVVLDAGVAAEVAVDAAAAVEPTAKDRDRKPRDKKPRGTKPNEVTGPVIETDL